MSKTIILDGLTDELKKKTRVNFKLNGGGNLTTHVLELVVTASHDNANALITDVYPFWANVINELSLQLGTGNDVFELSVRECILRQLVKREKIVSKIDKTSGADKISKLILNIDLNSLGYINPNDTALHTSRYNDKNLFIVGGSFDGVVDCTVSNVALRVKEHMLEDLAVPRYENGSVIALARKPIVKTIACNGKNGSFEIDFPEQSQITECYLYALDGNGVIVPDVISNIKIKNAHNTRIEDSFEDVQDKNQADLFKGINSLFSGVAYFNIGLGKYTRAIDTRQAREANTKFSLNVDPKEATDITIHAMFETLLKV